MLGFDSPTPLGEGAVESLTRRRKRSVAELPSLDDYAMDAMTPERRIKRLKPEQNGQVPTVLNY